MTKKRYSSKGTRHQAFVEGVDVLLAIRHIHSHNSHNIGIVCATCLHFITPQRRDCPQDPSCGISVIAAIRIRAGYAGGEHPSGRHGLHEEG